MWAGLALVVVGPGPSEVMPIGPISQANPLAHSPEAALAAQHLGDLSGAEGGMVHPDAVDGVSEGQVLVAFHLLALVVVGRARDREQFALTRDREAVQLGVDHLPSLFTRERIPGREAKKSLSTSSWPIFL